VPIAIGWGADGGTRRPLGLVIVGGLIVSQLITLYVTPVIYLYMELFQENVLNRIPFLATHYEGHGEAAALEHPHDDSANGDGNGQQGAPPAEDIPFATQTPVQQQEHAYKG
jgi:hypothetical protein